MSKLGFFALSADTFPILRVVSPLSLRSLKLSKVDSRKTLVQLATAYPDLGELELPKKFDDDDDGWIARIIRSPGITLEEVLRLFPRLCSISGVTHEYAPKTISRLKSAYPRLRRVNGTRVDEM